MPQSQRESGVYPNVWVNTSYGPDLIVEQRRSAQGIFFDGQPMPEPSADDLDLEAAQTLFGSRRQLYDKALTTLKLVRSEQNRLVPIHGGFLPFGKAHEQYFPHAWVQCGRFLGKLVLLAHSGSIFSKGGASAKTLGAIQYLLPGLMRGIHAGHTTG